MTSPRSRSPPAVTPPPAAHAPSPLPALPVASTGDIAFALHTQPAPLPAHPPLPSGTGAARGVTTPRPAHPRSTSTKTSLQLEVEMLRCELASKNERIRELEEKLVALAPPPDGVRTDTYPDGASRPDDASMSPPRPPPADSRATGASPAPRRKRARAAPRAHSTARRPLPSASISAPAVPTPEAPPPPLPPSPPQQPLSTTTPPP